MTCGFEFYIASDPHVNQTATGVTSQPSDWKLPIETSGSMAGQNQPLVNSSVHFLKPSAVASKIRSVARLLETFYY